MMICLKLYRNVGEGGGGYSIKYIEMELKRNKTMVFGSKVNGKKKQLFPRVKTMYLFFFSIFFSSFFKILELLVKN